MASTTGRTGSADGDLQVKVATLEETLSHLRVAVVDIQHRLSRLDGEALQWPGVEQEPRHTEPVGEGAEPLGDLQARLDKLEEETLQMVNEIRAQM